MTGCLFRLRGDETLQYAGRTWVLIHVRTSGGERRIMGSSPDIARDGVGGWAAARGPPTEFTHGATCKTLTLVCCVCDSLTVTRGQVLHTLSGMTYVGPTLSAENYVFSSTPSYSAVRERGRESTGDWWSAISLFVTPKYAKSEWV